MGQHSDSAHSTRSSQPASRAATSVSRCPGSFYPLLPSRSTSQRAGHDLRFGVRVHETTFRVNVRWVTPLGEETASTS